MPEGSCYLRSLTEFQNINTAVQPKVISSAFQCFVTPVAMPIGLLLVQEAINSSLFYKLIFQTEVLQVYKIMRQSGFKKQYLYKKKKCSTYRKPPDHDIFSSI